MAARWLAMTITEGAGDGGQDSVGHRLPSYVPVVGDVVVGEQVVHLALGKAVALGGIKQICPLRLWGALRGTVALSLSCRKSEHDR